VAPKINGAHRVFSIPEGVTAELIGFTVTGGSTTGDGGGILNGGTLAVTSSTVTANTADRGGGVHNLETGTLAVTDCNVFQNTAIQFAAGLNNAGHMDVIDSVVSANEAGDSTGGISNWPEGAIMTLTRTTVTGNIAARYGGGIGNAGTATLNGITLSNNQAGIGGGGITAGGDLTMVDSEVSGNVALSGNGGGVHNPGGSAMLQNTTVSFNSARNGGGISSGNPGTMLVLIGVTVHGNTAVSFGGGINAPSSAMTMINTTVSGNQAPFGSAISSGVTDGTANLLSSTLFGNVPADSVIYNSGTVTARNSIVEGRCVRPEVVSLGGNIESPSNTCGLSPGGTDQVNIPELTLNLGPLQDNGGPTMTHALLPGSVAIDWIPEADCLDADGAPLTIDQRGQPRPEPGGTMCDVGSFEVQSGGTGGTGGTGGGGGCVYGAQEHDAITCINGEAPTTDAGTVYFSAENCADAANTVYDLTLANADGVTQVYMWAGVQNGNCNENDKRTDLQELCRPMASSNPRTVGDNATVFDLTLQELVDTGIVDCNNTAPEGQPYEIYSFRDEDPGGNDVALEGYGVAPFKVVTPSGTGGSGGSGGSAGTPGTGGNGGVGGSPGGGGAGGG
jgi:hypothetical protein